MSLPAISTKTQRLMVGEMKTAAFRRWLPFAIPSYRRRWRNTGDPARCFITLAMQVGFAWMIGKMKIYHAGAVFIIRMILQDARRGAKSRRVLPLKWLIVSSAF